MTSAMIGVYFASRPGGSVAPSRTAAIGGTFVARIAGKMPATSVTTIPTVSEISTVLALRFKEVVGRSLLEALKSALTPRASRRPPTRPRSDASTPMTSASSVTDVSSCRRDAPIVRRVANSRMRCATVIESVLKMTNAPTKSAIAPNESRK